MLCRHCAQRTATRPRALCWTCYYLPGVKELYPPLSKFGHRGVGNVYRRCAAPLFPTSALPGTAEKIAVLAQRAALGQDLFHPEDASLEQVPRLAQVG